MSVARAEGGTRPALFYFHGERASEKEISERILMYYNKMTTRRMTGSHEYELERLLHMYACS
jgi:hypothetical protein